MIVAMLPMAVIMVMFMVVVMVMFVFVFLAVPFHVVAVVRVAVPVLVAVGVDRVSVAVGMGVTMTVVMGKVAGEWPRRIGLVPLPGYQAEQVGVLRNLFPGTVANPPDGHGREVHKGFRKRRNQRGASGRNQFALKPCAVHGDVLQDFQGGWRR